MSEPKRINVERVAAENPNVDMKLLKEFERLEQQVERLRQCAPNPGAQYTIRRAFEKRADVPVGRIRVSQSVKHR